MEPAQILEMARAYGLHGRLYVGRPFSALVSVPDYGSWLDVILNVGRHEAL